MIRQISKKLWEILQKPEFLAFVYFTILTIVMTYPLILRMGHFVIGQVGDNIYFVWLIRWYQKAIFELGISPFYNPNLNYPQGWNLASTDIAPAMVALALPGSLLFGQTWGYNFAMLLSFILTGWAMYLWVKHLTGDDSAALVAGTIFSFIPYRMLHFVAGHLSLVGTMWFPFYFWGLYDLLKQDEFKWRPVLMAVISAFLIGLTSAYYLYMTILLTIVFIIGWVVFGGWRRWRSHVLWKSLSLFGVFSIVLVGAAMYPYLSMDANDQLASRSIEYVSTFSASPTDFMFPSYSQILWGEFIREKLHINGTVEGTLYISVVSLILAVLGWVKRRQLEYTDLMNISVVVAIVAFILALGIEPHWMGQKVISIPHFLQPILGRSEMPQIYLPSYYLYKYLPFFSKMRAILRFGLFTVFFTSLMAGSGAYIIRKKLKPSHARWVGLLLLLLVFIDLYPGPFRQLARIDGRPVDYWLATQPNTGAVAQFPFSQDSDQDQVYNTLVHGKPYIGGFFNANYPEQYLRISPVMNGFPSRESVDLLKQLGVAYVVVDSSQYTDYPLVDSMILALGLRRLNIVGQQYVYGYP
jgi:hypothetical protein